MSRALRWVLASVLLVVVVSGAALWWFVLAGVTGDDPAPGYPRSS